jgi:cell growth-regulating nucleolar protein
MHKALKRYHRDYPSSVGSEEREGDRIRGRAKGRDRDRRGDEENELWRMLRLKKNDRGEVVVFV